MEYENPADIGDVSINLDDSPTRRNVLRPEKHLDSPITISLLQRLVNLHDLICEQNKTVRPTQYDPHREHAAHKFLGKNPDLAYSSIRSSLMQYMSALDFCKKTPEILDAKCYPSLFDYGSQPGYRLQTDYRLARRIFSKERDAYLSMMKDIITPAKLKVLSESLTPPDFLDQPVVLSSCRVQLWSDIVEEYRKLYKQPGKRIKREKGPVKYVICDGFLLIRVNAFERWKLMTYEQLQMIQDCCLARHNIELSLQFKFHNGTPSLRYHVNQIIIWQEKVLTTIGNDGYELVKAPEAIFKARLNTITSGDSLKYTSFQRTVDKMAQKEFKLHKTDRLIREFAAFAESVHDLGDAAELFGLSKITGHPVVYAIKSAESVRKEAEPQGTIQPFAVRQMVRMFKHLTLSGYIRLHSSWPPLRCPPAIGTTLRRLFLNQVTELPVGSYPLSDIDSIQFDKFVEYDYSEDYLKFLDDKAICPGAKELGKFWFGGDGEESRRLLQKILSLKHFDTVELVERLRRGNFKADERVVELTQKERELKCAARCFCKLPFAVRTFFTSTEYNLKEQFMSKYMPQQTMTMSNTETKQRLYSLVKTARLRDRLLLEVDFSRWNLRWRQETVNPISLELEDIFGLSGVFSQAHPFFSSATIVLTDKHHLPLGATPNKPVTEWPVSELVWRGTHLGGFEGIQQALWTVCTIAMMYWVLHDQNLAFNMAGQGDNQIFAITFNTSNEDISSQLRRLLAVMEVRCSLLNHEVKPDECIDSRTVLTYSKDIYVEGNHILYNLKFASRTFKREEIDIPSLSSEIASISACSMACADSVYNTPMAIFWKTFHTLRLLSQRMRSPNHTAEKSDMSRLLQNENALEFSLLTPGSIGGFPIMSWGRFFMKGEVDDLSWDVASHMHLASESSALAWDMKLVLNGKYKPSKINLEQIILDPHSIPLDRPKDMKRLVKDAVEDKLLDNTANLWMREIFSDTSKLAGESLMRDLITTVPFYPEIMSDVYSLSPSGVRDALISRFTMTRTITAITGNPNFSLEIEAANAKLINFILTRFRNANSMKGVPQLPTSSYERCKILRSHWGPNVEHKNIGVYCPLDFGVKFASQSAAMITASSRSDSSSLHSTLGPYPPNFGTKTKQKVSDHGFKIVSSSSTVADLKKLIVTYSELGATPQLGKLFSQITHSRSPWSVTQLLAILPTSYGGSAAHRHKAINSTGFSILGSRTVPTHLNFCSDNAGKLSGGEFDYPIAFQEFYLTLTNLFQSLVFNDVLDSNAAIGFLLSDDYEELTTDDVVCGPIKTRYRWTVKPTNKLCYVANLQCTELPLIPQKSQMRHNLPSEYRPASLIYNRLLSKYARKHKLARSTSSVNLPIEMMDMKEFAHCPLSELLRGTIWFITAMAIYAAVTEYTRDAAVFLHDTIRIMCNASSGLLTRLMLHPDFNDTQYAVETGVVCEPGMTGARNAANNLSGELYSHVIASIKARDFTLPTNPLILFADYEGTGVLMADIHCTAFLSLQSRDVKKILITSRQRLLLKSARHVFSNDSRTLMTIMAYRATVNSFALQSVEHVKPENSEIRSVAMSFCNSTADEAIRILRDRPKELRLRVRESTGMNFERFEMVESCMFDEDTTDGTLLPKPCDCIDDDFNRNLDRFAAQFTRPIGVFSSAVSVWASILNNHKRLLHDKRVISIGVGHGAIASVSLRLGAKFVYGVDLRASFPCVSQREATYKPPEIVTNGLSKRFEWSRFISLSGGDIIKHCQKLQYIESAETWIIDIEQDPLEMLTMFEHIPAGISLIVRLHCCRDWAQYFLDAFSADVLYCTTLNTKLKIKSYIFVCTKFQSFNRSANYQRRVIVSEPSFKSTLVKDTRYATDLVNNIVRQYGQACQVISAPELDRISSHLRNRTQFMSNDQERLRMLDVVLALEKTAYCFRNDTLITQTDIVSFHPTVRRLLGRWFANVGISLERLKNLCQC